VTKGWKEVANALGFVLLFGITGWNLWNGGGIFVSIFRGVVAWLVFQILNILVTNLIVRILSEYELKRLREIAEQEELEELRRAEMEAEESGEPDVSVSESQQRPTQKAAQKKETKEQNKESPLKPEQKEEEQKTVKSAGEGE
jgi:hypothetical protein